MIYIWFKLNKIISRNILINKLAWLRVSISWKYSIISCYITCTNGPVVFVNINSGKNTCLNTLKRFSVLGLNESLTIVVCFFAAFLFFHNTVYIKIVFLQTKSVTGPLAVMSYRGKYNFAPFQICFVRQLTKVVYIGQVPIILFHLVICDHGLSD